MYIRCLKQKCNSVYHLLFICLFIYLFIRAICVNTKILQIIEFVSAQILMK